MSKKFFIPLLFTVASLISCSSLSESERPNIVWIIAEDLSQDLGAYGNNLVDTSNIDQLARKGVTSTHVFTTSPVCSPSRTALATGMYQTSIGARHMRYPDELKPELPDSIQIVHQLFRKNGYVTASIEDKPAIGKTDWMFKADMEANFDYNHWDNLISQNKPFFGQVSISNIHRPFPEVESNAEILDKVKTPPYYPNNNVVGEDWTGYYKSANILDDKVGQILNVLRENDLDQNTIVIFFSDHGQPMTPGKHWNYDSGTRVPMIIYIHQEVHIPDKYTRGDIEDQLISHIDITTTTLSLAGIQKPNYVQGRIFWDKDQVGEREYVFSAPDRIGELYFKSRAVRSRRFKYIRNYHHDFSINSASTAYRKAHHPIYHVMKILNVKEALTPNQQSLVKSLSYEELYDLKKDPYEMNNLADDKRYQDELKTMQHILDDWIGQTVDQGLNPDSEEIISAFKQYGEESLERYRKQIQQPHDQVRKRLK